MTIVHCVLIITTLVFQEEELDEHNNQVTPPGFHLIFLPFADDFRKLKYEETPKGIIHFTLKLQ